MSRLRALLVSSLLVVSFSAAGPYRPQPSPSPSAIPEHEKCYLTVVEGVVKSCCEKTGEFLGGITNCTNFAYNFDKLCSEALGPENCFTVSVSCPNARSGHRLNMVKLGDNRYYVVEPQGEIYYEHPLSSPRIPDELLCQIIEGCGCSAEVFPYSKEPNTWDRCSDNDSRLLGGYGNRPGPEMLNRCYSCCDIASIPPSHPDPESFRSICRGKCEFNYKPEPEDGDEFFDKYCSRMYSGRACRMCCSYLAEGKTCEDSCVDAHAQFGEIPKQAPAQCRKEHVEGRPCYECCKEQYSFCGAHDSIPCKEWMHQCIEACNVPRAPPSLTPSPYPSPKK